VIAGSSSDLRLSNLRDYWQADTIHTAELPIRGLMLAWMSSISTRLLGSPRFFYPRFPLRVLALTACTIWLPPANTCGALSISAGLTAGMSVSQSLRRT
jgi:hypothetical protein